MKHGENKEDTASAQTEQNAAEKTTAPIAPLGPLTMLTLGLLIGIIGGFGAIFFRMLIAFFHNLLFYGRFDLFYDVNLHTPISPWGIGIILVPVIGAVFVVWLVKSFAPEAKGHGVPEVIDAIYFNDGKIRPLVAFIKSLASALSIGSGGAVGREGPIIQIGAAFGSTLGQIVAMPRRQRITLIAAGAGAGIAATFNAPIGGVTFAIELLLVSVNAATLSVVAMATITATYISRLFLGLYPAFNIPALALPDGHLIHFFQLILFIPFGILIGLMSTLFIQALYWCEDKFEAFLINPYLQHMFGMLLLGIMLYLFVTFSGHYYVQGVGYASIVDVLNQTLTNPWFLLLLCFAKLLAMCLTLGSGASGGVFSPALFIGATFGAAFGRFMIFLFPHAGFDPIMFPIAGMAGMVSGTTGAVLTAITMLFEMTRDYHAILPIVLTAGLAYVTRTRISNESIYTLKLLRRGHQVHEGLQAAINAAQRAVDLMSEHFLVLSKSDYEAKGEEWQAAYAAGLPIIVSENNQVLGVFPAGTLQHNLVSLDKYHYIVVKKNTSMLEVLRALRHNQATVALVCLELATIECDDIIGVISAHEVLDMATESALLMNESF